MTLSPCCVALRGGSYRNSKADVYRFFQATAPPPPRSCHGSCSRPAPACLLPPAPYPCLTFTATSYRFLQAAIVLPTRWCVRVGDWGSGGGVGGGAGWRGGGASVVTVVCGRPIHDSVRERQVTDATIIICSKIWRAADWRSGRRDSNLGKMEDGLHLTWCGWVQERHAAHYLIVNLCSERSYLVDTFHGNCVRCTHTPPRKFTIQHHLPSTLVALDVI
jgi:hypothetical protein